MSRKVGLAKRVTLQSKKGKPARQVTCSSLTRFFVSNVKGSPNFVRKCRKRQLVEGSSGGGVTLLCGTSFLFINQV